MSEEGLWGGRFSLFLDGQKRDAPFVEEVGEAVGLSAGSDVGEPDIVGQRGYDFIPATGVSNADAAFGVRENGKEQKSAGCEGFLPFSREALWQTSGRTEYDWRCPAQKDAKALLFYG